MSSTGAEKPKRTKTGDLPSPTLRRFHGTIGIDEQDPIGGFTEIVQNVIEQFAAQYGAEVTITLDVEARRQQGFETKTVRVVRENAATLKFRTAEFEEE